MAQITVDEALAELNRMRVPSLGGLMKALGSRPGVTPRQVRDVWQRVQHYVPTRGDYAPVPAIHDELERKARPPKPFYMDGGRGASRWQEVG